MQTPLQITFRHADSSPALEARIHECLEHLGRALEGISSCRVIISGPSVHHRHGSPFSIRIETHVRGRHYCVDTDGTAKPAHADVYAALHDAFDTLKRMLQEHERRLRTARKQPSAPACEA
jgi:ribosome-associated translation inhibitor RaiA